MAQINFFFVLTMMLTTPMEKNIIQHLTFSYNRNLYFYIQVKIISFKSIGNNILTPSKQGNTIIFFYK